MRPYLGWMGLAGLLGSGCTQRAAAPPPAPTVEVRAPATDADAKPDASAKLAPEKPLAAPEGHEAEHGVAGVPRHFYFAGASYEGITSVNLHDLEPEAWDALYVEYEAGREKLAADAPAVPGWLRRGPWVAVEGSKVTTIELAGFEIIGGADDTWLEARLAGVPAGASLIVVGEAPEFGEVEWLGFDERESNEGVSLPASMRAAIDGIRPPGEHGPTVVHAVEGRFGHGRRIVAVNQVLEAGETDDEGQLAALALLDDKGALLEWLLEPRLSLDAIELQGWVRFSPEGPQHLIFTLSYYEGAFEYLLVWTGEGHERWAIGGDGA